MQCSVWLYVKLYSVGAPSRLITGLQGKYVWVYLPGEGEWREAQGQCGEGEEEETQGEQDQGAGLLIILGPILT